MRKRLLFMLLVLPVIAQAAKGPAVPDYPLDRINEQVYVIHGPIDMPNPENQGFMNNPGVILTSKGVVIIDPGASVQSGEMVLRRLKTISQQPVVAVFNTHIHGDHWLGNQAIKEAYPKAVIYGHPRMIELIAEGEGDTWVDLMMKLSNGKTEGTKVVGPDKASNHGDVITVGGVTFKVHHYGAAHTDSDLMIEVVEPSVIFLGDNLLRGRVPRMGEGNTLGNITSVEKALEAGVTSFVPGHGGTTNAGSIKHAVAYLQILYSTVKTYYDEGLSDFEMKPQVSEALKDYKSWINFDAMLGKNISITYLQVEEADF